MNNGSKMKILCIIIFTMKKKNEKIHAIRCFPCSLSMLMILIGGQKHFCLAAIDKNYRTVLESDEKSKS